MFSQKGCEASDTLHNLWISGRTICQSYVNAYEGIELLSLQAPVLRNGLNFEEGPMHTHPQEPVECRSPFVTSFVDVLTRGRLPPKNAAAIP